MLYYTPGATAVCLHLPHSTRCVFLRCTGYAQCTVTSAFVLRCTVYACCKGATDAVQSALCLFKCARFLPRLPCMSPQLPGMSPQMPCAVPWGLWGLITGSCSTSATTPFVPRKLSILLAQASREESGLARCTVHAPSRRLPGPTAKRTCPIHNRGTPRSNRTTTAIIGKQQTHMIITANHKHSLCRMADRLRAALVRPVRRLRARKIPLIGSRCLGSSQDFDEERERERESTQIIKGTLQHRRFRADH